MRKLIHIEDSRAQLVCDNPRCKYELPEGAVTWGKHLIGYPCPRCDSNMLTLRDYRDSERIFAWIARLNKWFGWLGSEAPEPNARSVWFRNHNGKLIKERGDAH